MDQRQNSKIFLAKILIFLAPTFYLSLCFAIYECGRPHSRQRAHPGRHDVVRHEQNHRRQDRKPTAGISGYGNYLG